MERNLRSSTIVKSFLPSKRVIQTREHADERHIHFEGRIEDTGNPIITLMYEFFIDPESSTTSHYWALLLAWLAVGQVLIIALESCDGPNQYDKAHKADRSKYKFLLNTAQYLTVSIVCMVPQIVDTAGRIFMMGFVIFGEENVELYEDFFTDKLEFFLLFTDIFAIIPFLINTLYINPSNVNLQPGANFFLVLLQLLITGRILRVIKDIPPVWAVRVTLSRSARHLILPIFIFITFNITAGVFFYFLEPCYNLDTCSWVNLFEATFFSIVSMTTVGYGNQVPEYEFGRFVACLVMIFGALFLSMPLAILGNEYDSAWHEISKQLQKEREEQLREEMELEEALLKKKMPLTFKDMQEKGGSLQMDSKEIDVAEVKNSTLAKESPVNPPKTILQHISDHWESKQIQRSKDTQLTFYHPIMMSYRHLMETLKELKTASKGLRRLNPFLLFKLSESRAALTALVTNIQMTMQRLDTPLIMEGSLPTVAASPPWKPRNNHDMIQPDHLDHHLDHPNVRKSSKQEMQEENLKKAHNALRRLSVQIVAQHQQQHHHHHPSAVVPHPSPLESRSHQPTFALTTNSIPFHSVNPIEEGDESFKSNQLQSTELTTQASNPTAERNKMARTTSVFNRLIDKIGPQPVAPTPDNLEISNLEVNVRALNIPLVPRLATEDYIAQLERVAKDPTNYRNRLWILLELPHSSYEGRFIQIMLIVLICLSVFVFYSETVVELSGYGEESAICGRVMNLYCFYKSDNTLDPGCYVQTYQGPTDTKLSYDCSDTNCFGNGLNFGSTYTNMTCSNVNIPPFQNAQQLGYTYGVPYLLTSRPQMHRINPICSRIECAAASRSLFAPSNDLWIVCEFITNGIFTFEVILRIIVSQSFWGYFTDLMNSLDILSIVPFYALLIATFASSASFHTLSFSVLASSPDNLVLVFMRSLKIIRMFKITRHFDASIVLKQTATKVWKQILGMIMLLFFLTVLFAILIFEIEGGKACFVGDPGCDVPDSVEGIVHTGDRIVVNINGQLSAYSNVFFGVWFSVVTLTTTGYGDIIPVTAIGQGMAICLMLAGILFMAMPLTAAASTFYHFHQKYYEHEENGHPAFLVHASEEDKPVDSMEHETKEDLPDQSMVMTTMGQDHQKVKMDESVRRSVDQLMDRLQSSQKDLTEFFACMMSSPMRSNPWMEQFQRLNHLHDDDEGGGGGGDDEEDDDEKIQPIAWSPTNASSSLKKPQNSMQSPSKLLSVMKCVCRQIEQLVKSKKGSIDCEDVLFKVCKYS